VEPTILGRDAETAVLRRALATASKGEGVTVVLVGEAGVGKSHLLSTFTQATARQGAVVADIDVPSEPLSPPFEPLRALATRWGYLPGASDLSAALERGAQPREVRRHLDELVASMAAHDTVVLVLDRAQAAESALITAIGHVARRSTHRRVLTILSMRPDDIRLGPLLEVTDALVLPVEPLDPVSAEELVRALADDGLDEADLDDVVARAGGNPLFLIELTAALGRNDGTRPDPGAGTLGLLLLRRIEKLSPAATDTLRVASVCSEPVHPRFCALVTGRDPENGAVNELVDEGLAAVSEDGLISFPNPVIPEVVVTATPRAAMAEIRGRIAGLLSFMGADAAVVAPHALAATTLPGTLGASPIPVAIEAALGALAKGAPTSTLDLVERALDLNPQPDHERELVTLQGEALLNLGRNAEAADAFERAIALGADDDATLGLARALQRGGRLAQALDVFERCEGLGGARGRAEVLLGLGRTREAAAAAADAVAAARASGDEAALAAALGDQALAEAVRSHASAVALGSEAVALWRRLGEDSLEWPPLFALGVALEADDRFEESLQVLGDLRSWLDARGMLDLVPRPVRTETISAFLSCRWARMDEALAAAIDAKRGPNHEMGPIWASAAALAAARGDDHGWERSNARSHEALAEQATPFDRALAAWWRSFGHIFRKEGREAAEAAEAAATGFRRIGALDFLARTLPLIAAGGVGRSAATAEAVAHDYGTLVQESSRASIRAGEVLVGAAAEKDRAARAAALVEAARVFGTGEHRLGALLAVITVELLGAAVPADLREMRVELVGSLQMSCPLVETLAR